MSSSANDPKLQDQKGFNESSPTTDNDHQVHDSSDNSHEPYLKPKTPDDHDASSLRSRSSARETNTRLADDLAVMEAERVVSQSTHDAQSKKSRDHHSIRSRRSAVDEFDEATNPLHERAALYQPPEKPTTKVARFVKTLHESSFVVRYLTYIVPLVVILLIPLLVGALAFPEANVGGVSLLWFSVWLEILWLTAWAGRVVAKCIPFPVGIFASIFTDNAKKWRDVAKQLELPGTFFFWFLGVEISFLPTMKNHHVDGNKDTRGWENTVNKIIISIFVWTILNLIEKFLVQLIAMSYYSRTYSDRIDINKFQIGALAKMYAFSRTKLVDEKEDSGDQQDQGPNGSHFMKPLQYAGKAQKVAKGALNKVGDVAGAVAADFTGRKATNRNDPHQVVLTLLRTVPGSQGLARRLYRTYKRDGFDSIVANDLKATFENDEEAETVFAMLDKDFNGDLSMDELEAVLVEIGRERKAITSSLKDLDSVVSRLGNVLDVFVFIITLMVFLSLISTSAAGVLTSAGSTILALSWLFSTTAVEFLQSVIFVFVKHPFDVGDRITVYGNTGAAGLGDDYFVKQISLLYTEFKKMEGHIVQAPNSYLSTLFILNHRRSGALAEAVPIVIKFGTTIDQIETFRLRLQEFAASERRDFQSHVITEMREVTNNFSVTLNVVFFYKSSWQNEGLRLQRRNKFICMLMVVLQEVGIQGPHMNWPGARLDIPFHLAGLSSLLSGSAAGHSPPSDPSTENDLPKKNTEDSSDGAAHHPSILRKGMDTAAAQARGDSKPTRKHVDFSLGMQNLSSADVMGDVFDERTDRTEDLLRRAAAVKEEQEGRELSERQNQSQSRSSSVQLPSHSDAGEGRRSIESQHSRLSSVSHRRFFRHRNNARSPNDPDVEQGGYDHNTQLTTAPTAPEHRDH
ncbi:hypothetical protein SI65_09614 [Aspergillus cristatus]|uniref:Mechanosensitive ion channel protein n=1 Tax=Aspergillus cristatus TaxID=573508 RepID=A0A1E3B1Q0_ASPCR|nr:hypothetical protein SI65_09614 [Aspergillus cristatus]